MAVAQLEVCAALPLRCAARLSGHGFSLRSSGGFADYAQPPATSCNPSIEERRLFPGDTLALYTDGVTESFNEAQEEFGEERLVAALQRHRKLPSRELLAAIVAEVQQFSPGEQHDDITLIIARCGKN